MENKTPKICLKNLKGFKPLEKDDKIETQMFLSASEEIVQVIETFGRLFTPVTMDMRMNMQKVNALYEKDPHNFAYLEHLIEKYNSIEPLIWLKRALNLILIFFQNILTDLNETENVKEHLKNAYEKTLKHHHGIIVKHTVALIYRWVPKRSELLGCGELHNENLIVLSQLLDKMEQHINRMNMLLNDYPKLNI